MKKVFSKMTIKFLTIFFLLNAISSPEVLAQINRRAPSGETTAFPQNRTSNPTSKPTPENSMSVLAKPVAQLEESKKADKAKLDSKDSKSQTSKADSLRSGKHTVDTVTEAESALKAQDKDDEENKDKNPKNPQAASVSMPAAVTAKSSSSAANWLLPLAAIAGVGAIALLPSGSDDPSSSSEAVSSWKDPSVVEDATVTYSPAPSSSSSAAGAPSSATSVRVYDKAKVEEWFEKHNIKADEDGDFTASVRALNPALGQDFLKKAKTMNEIHQNLSEVETLAGKDKVKYACEGEGARSCGLDYEGIRKGLEEYASYRERELALKAQIARKPDSEAADLRSELNTVKTNMQNLSQELRRHIQSATQVANQNSNPVVKRLFQNASDLLTKTKSEIEQADAAKIRSLLPHLKKDWNHFVKKHSEFGHEPELAERDSTSATRDMLVSATQAPTLLAELPAEIGVLDTYSPHRGASSDQWISPSDAADFRNL